MRSCPQALALLLVATSVTAIGCSDASSDDGEATGSGEAEVTASRSGYSVRRDKDIRYGTEAANVLDLYTPTGGPTRNRPLVVWIHGGAFAFGTRRDPHLVTLAKHTASLGYVSVSIDYTLANGNVDREHPFPYPANAITTAARDARTAIRFLRQHAADYGIDPNDVAVGGASAGAITALQVAYGTTAAKRDEGIRAVVDLWGAFESDKGIEPGDAPLLILHGTMDDHWMPFRQATRLRDSARAAGVPCKFIPLPGKNHGPWEDLDDYLDDITPFLRRYLGPR